MKVKRLQIELPEYGSDAGQYVGNVILSGPHGEMTIRLSSGAIGRIFGVVASEAAATARANANQVARGIDDAANSTALLTHTIEV